MTAQIPEGLILGGEETSMAGCPPLPDGHPRVFEPGPDDAVRNEDHDVQESTDCWRGYQGTWEIKDGRFYLIGLRGRFRLRDGEPLLASWFSGVLRIPKGEVLQYVHMGFGSVYEQEVHAKVEKGLVVETRVVDNRRKQHDKKELGLRNLPGGENRFPGDDEL